MRGHGEQGIEERLPAYNNVSIDEVKLSDEISLMSRVPRLFPGWLLAIKVMVEAKFFSTHCDKES